MAKDNELFEILLDDAATAIYVADCETDQLIYLNHTAEKILGVKAEKILCKKCYSMMNLSKPCPFCHKERFVCSEYHEGKVKFPTNGQQYHISSKIVNLHGRNVHVHYVSDETKLLDEQKKLRTLTDNISTGIGIYYAYSDGKIEAFYNNDGYYKMMGTTREERMMYMGGAVSNAIEPSDANRLKLEIAAAIKENRQIRAEIRVINGEGNYKWLNICADIVEKNEEKTTLYCAFSDVDYLKNIQHIMENNNALLCLALECAKVDTWKYNLDEKIIYYTDESIQENNLPREIENAPDFFFENNLIHPNSIEDFKKLYENVQNKKKSRGEFLVRNTETSDYQWKRVIYQPINDGECLEAMGVSIDITEEKNSTELEIELESQRKSNAAQADFLAKMSHELRTPLNVIIGSSTLANDISDVPGDMKTYIKQIDYSAKYLLGMINDILDSRRMENGEFTLEEEWTRPDEVLKPALYMMVSEYKNKGVNLIYDENCSLDDVEYNLDVIRCRQILINLLNNALKFTSPGGTVSFYDEHIKRDEEYAYEKFIVSDTGCGMSEEFKKVMFEPFTQEKNRNCEFIQGTGLGLSLVHQLVEKMNGKIEVDSELNKGTTFYITIPFKWRMAATEESKEQQYDYSILEGKHILLVEDHPMNSMIAKRLLEKNGMIVDVVSNGLDAIDKFKINKDYYDIILMDIRMPKMNGLEASIRIRSIDSTEARSIPIIAMTANTDVEDVRASIEAGMNAHLSKPINPNEMYNMILKFVMEGR